MISSLRILAISWVLVLTHTCVATAQDVDIRIFSSAAGGGALIADYPFATPQRVFQSFCAGGSCLFSSSDPGFRTAIQSEPSRELFALTSGTQVTIEVLAVAEGVSVKVGTHVLRVPGEQAVLGNAPSLHLHPSWQVTLPQGVGGDFPFRFRLSASGAYSTSAPYELVLTNASAATPTATTPATVTALPTATLSATSPPSSTLTSSRRPTPTATPTRVASPTLTPRPGALRGDVDCDDRVSAADVIGLLALRADPPITLSCGADVVEDGDLDDADLAGLLHEVFAQ